MLEIIDTGGPLFMVPLLLLFAVNMIMAFGFGFRLYKGKTVPIQWVRHLGIFCLAFGILGQCIGLYSAFLAIEEWGSVRPEVLYAGIRVSSITTITGIVIFLVSYLLWFGLEFLSNYLNESK